MKNYPLEIVYLASLEVQEMGVRNKIPFTSSRLAKVKKLDRWYWDRCGETHTAQRVYVSNTALESSFQD